MVVKTIVYFSLERPTDRKSSTTVRDDGCQNSSTFLFRAAARRDMVLRTLSAGKGVAHNLSESDLDTLCEKTDGYSGSDMKHLIQEAA